MDLGLENSIISGELLNQLYAGCKFVKFTNNDEKECYDFQLSTGLNERKLNTSSNFAYGGIKFNFIDNFVPHLNTLHDVKYFRYVTVPDDAQVYIEDKYFTSDKLVLDDRDTIQNFDMWNDEDFCIEMQTYSDILVTSQKIYVKL
jgi:hypothetical protein